MSRRAFVLWNGSWCSFLILCYLGWTLEKVKIVNCVKSDLDLVNSDDDSVLFDEKNRQCFSQRLEKDPQYITNCSIRESILIKNESCLLEPAITQEEGITKCNSLVHTTLENVATSRLVKSWASQVQVHIPASSAVRNELCRNHSLIALDRFQQFDLWALKMIDSSAKLSSGILNGNINQYGDFDQCLSVETNLDGLKYADLEEHHVKGKYCLAFIDVELKNATRTSKVFKQIESLIHSHRPFISTVNDPGHRIARFSTVIWGLCIPSSCSAEDLDTSLSESLYSHFKDTEVAVKVKVDPDMCYVRTSQPLSTGTKLTLVFIGSILILVTMGTWLDKSEQMHNRAKSVQLVRSFSLKRNVQKLLSTKTPPDDISCVHGVRALSALALILFHKSAALFFNPIVNRTAMAESFGSNWTVIARISIIYTDSFILISGLLTSCSLLRELDRHKRINIWERYVTRYFRFTPNLMAIILFCTYVMVHLNSGPQWNLVVKHHSDLCQNNMWRNFLYIHNYFGFENMCLTHTHQLGIDMQLFIVAPLFVYLLWRRRWFGLGVLAYFAVLSSFYRYVVTYQKELSTVLYFGAPVSRLFNTASLSYILPTHRLTIYLMGIGLGYALHLTKGVLNLNKVTLGWIIASVMAVLAVFGPHHMSLPNYQYNPQDAALYNALSPILWGIFLGWVILAGYNGYAGFLGDILSWKGFVVFSRLAYSVYLTQFPVFFYNVGSTRTPLYYTTQLLFEIGEIFCIILASIALTLFIDLPFQEVKKIIWDQDKRYSHKAIGSSLRSQEMITKPTELQETDKQQINKALTNRNNQRG